MNTTDFDTTAELLSKHGPSVVAIAIMYRAFQKTFTTEFKVADLRSQITEIDARFDLRLLLQHELITLDEIIESVSTTDLFHQHFAADGLQGPTNAKRVVTQRFPKHILYSLSRSLLIRKRLPFHTILPFEVLYKMISGQTTVQFQAMHFLNLYYFFEGRNELPLVLDGERTVQLLQALYNPSKYRH